MVLSAHYKTRKYRIELINEIGLGRIVRTVFWDRHHPDGPEIHTISSTGIVTIYNALTGKLITQLIARPAQLRRYYDGAIDCAICPQYLLDLAQEHKYMKYNCYN